MSRARNIKYAVPNGRQKRGTGTPKNIWMAKRQEKIAIQSILGLPLIETNSDGTPNFFLFHAMISISLFSKVNIHIVLFRTNKLTIKSTLFFILFLLVTCCVVL